MLAQPPSARSAGLLAQALNQKDDPHDRGEENQREDQLPEQASKTLENPINALD